jgi:two-component system chemotaxis sensor kinase CheA
VRVKREGEQVFSAPETYREVVRSLVHLFNNAVDHGIETPEEREAIGKLPMGSIVANYGRFSDNSGRPWIRLVIQDDGRGINVAKLREKARIHGENVDAKSDLEVMHMVFEEGVTTRDTVTEVSGQGVGMGALRATILKARGRIKITKSDGQGTTFEISIPVPKEKPKTAASSMPAAS